MTATIRHPVTPRIERVLTIRRSADDLYARLRDFGELATFMPNVVSVTEDNDRSCWVLRGPRGPMRLDAMLTGEEPGRRIAWSVLDGTVMTHTGEVRFEPSIQGTATQVRVIVTREPSSSFADADVAELTDDNAAQHLREELWRFKQWMETGNVPTTHGQTRGSAQAESLEEERSEVAGSETSLTSAPGSSSAATPPNTEGSTS